ncbi:ATP-dependent metallopeptidase FtsH/Yme1/Tma family protein, partial [Treponema sp. R6D11]
MNKKNNFGSGVFIYLFLFLAIFALVAYSLQGDAIKYNYTDLYKAIKNGEVTELKLSDTHAVATLKNDKTIDIDIPSIDFLYDNHQGIRPAKTVST